MGFRASKCLQMPKKCEKLNFWDFELVFQCRTHLRAYMSPNPVLGTLSNSEFRRPRNSHFSLAVKYSTLKSSKKPMGGGQNPVPHLSSYLP